MVLHPVAAGAVVDCGAGATLGLHHHLAGGGLRSGARAGGASDNAGLLGFEAGSLFFQGLAGGGLCLGYTVLAGLLLGQHYLAGAVDEEGAALGHAPEAVAAGLLPLLALIGDLEGQLVAGVLPAAVLATVEVQLGGIGAGAPLRAGGLERGEGGSEGCLAPAAQHGAGGIGLQDGVAGAELLLNGRNLGAALAGHLIGGGTLLRERAALVADLGHVLVGLLGVALQGVQACRNSSHGQSLVLGEGWAGEGK